MQTKDTNRKPEDNQAMRQFREWMVQHYVNVSINGADKEFHTSMELLWRMRETIPQLTIGDVCKVLGELLFETTCVGDIATWVLYRIDGQRQLENEFGVGDNIEPAD